MAPPTPLAIQTAAITRLLKEERSYHTELAQQQRRLATLVAATAQGAAATDDAEGNAEFGIAQEKRAIVETEAIFPELRRKVEDAVLRVENLLEQDGLDEAEVVRAREVVREAKAGA
ncbi:MAG: hypothetical protein M1832_001495 [Thelocarpon impressellum]|nr:MAG: hypothetical protein M1832_001495 [Thelocarpon impressellum]